MRIKNQLDELLFDKTLVARKEKVVDKPGGDMDNRNFFSTSVGRFQMMMLKGYNEVAKGCAAQQWAERNSFALASFELQSSLSTPSQIQIQRAWINYNGLQVVNFNPTQL